MKKFKSQNAKGKVTSTFASAVAEAMADEQATADKLQNSKLVLVLTGAAAEGGESKTVEKENRRLEKQQPRCRMRWEG